MYISKSNVVLKHILIGLLFFSFSAFKPALPSFHHQSKTPSFNEIQVIVLTNGAIELIFDQSEKDLKHLPEIEHNSPQPLPKTNIIVDDVVVMIQDASNNEDGLAAVTHEQHTTSKYPFPG